LFQVGLSNGSAYWLTFLDRIDPPKRPGGGPQNYRLCIGYDELMHYMFDSSRPLRDRKSRSQNC